MFVLSISIIIQHRACHSHGLSTTAGSRTKSPLSCRDAPPEGANVPLEPVEAVEPFWAIEIVDFLIKNGDFP